MVTANPFSMLEEVVVEEVAEKEGRVEGEAQERREGADGCTLPQGKVIVLGDSQIRHLDSSFCARDREHRSRVCLPGTGIGRVSARIDT